MKWVVCELPTLGFAMPSNDAPLRLVRPLHALRCHNRLLGRLQKFLILAIEKEIRARTKDGRLDSIVNLPGF